MKEYVGQTGGRFLYVDDIENLQDLAKSSEAIFKDFGNLIISGCKPIDGKITGGFVFLNDKIRSLSETKVTKYPAYIVESNSKESVAYQDEQVKVGAINYGCKVVFEKPTDSIDPITGKAVEFIEVSEDNAKNKTLKNVFFGKYSLINSPSSGRQSVNGDFIFNGLATFNKDVDVKGWINIGSGFHIESDSKGAILSTINGAIRKQRMFIGDDGSVVVYGDGGNVEFKNGVASFREVKAPIIKTSSISSNTGILKINNNTGGKATSLEIYSGDGTKAWLRAEASDDKMFVEKKVIGADIIAKDFINSKDSVNYLSRFLLTDSNGIITGSLESDSKVIKLKAVGKNIVIEPKRDGKVDVVGEINAKSMLINNKDIKDMFVSQSDYDTFVDKAVVSESGKGLSTNDFTDSLKEKLSQISTSDIDSGGDGYVVASDAQNTFEKYIRKDNFIDDLEIKDEDAQKAICNHLGVLHKTDAQGKIKQTKWIQMNHYSGGKLYTLWVKQFGSIVHISGTINTSEQANGIFARLPNEIDSPPHPVVYAVHDISSKQGNRGIEFRIDANAREIKQSREKEYGGNKVTINLTYIV